MSGCGTRIVLRGQKPLALCDRCPCFGSLFPPLAALTFAASNIICAFGLASAAPRSPYRHLELCGIALKHIEGKHKMKYKKAITALALAALLLAGCAAPQAVQAPAPQQTAKAAETQSGVTFTDAMGYPVTVQSWNRVVSLYGSFAEAWTLAGGTLTATTEDAIKERGLDLGTDIAVIGTNRDPNTEEILVQNPDFVILNAEVSEQTALHEFLQEAGVPHAYFKTNTFDEYLAMLRTFCDMTGREDLYEQNGLAVQQQISDVLELVQNAKLPAPNVLLLRAYSSGCKAKGSDNMTGAMLKDLGAINIADADDSLLENLSMENIIADDPEAIFVVTMGASQQKALDWLAENLQANPAWSGLSAVQSGHYYLLDKALFHYKPNARWGESYRTLAALLYPQLADQLEALA
ncbi:MAG: ABC transporter substrate-binding protein [Subdoligranulum sp.]|nr:ABC transporter substrate-binding protein [Subdoligranulum sp.]